VRTVELVREGVRTFTDLAIVGVVLVLIAQVVGPVRGVVAGLAELAAMIVAAAVLAQPLVAIKLRVIGKAQSPIGGTKKAQLKLVQIGAYAGIWGAIALTDALLSSTVLAD